MLGPMKILDESNGYTLFVDGGKFFVQGPLGKAIQFVDEGAARFTYGAAVFNAAPEIRDGTLHPAQGKPTHMAEARSEFPSQGNTCGGMLVVVCGALPCDNHMLRPESKSKRIRTVEEWTSDIYTEERRAKDEENARRARHMRHSDDSMPTSQEGAEEFTQPRDVEDVD